MKSRIANTETASLEETHWNEVSNKRPVHRGCYMRDELVSVLQYGSLLRYDAF
jgi:hypothetical protein